MKFYQLYKIFELFTYVIYNKTILHNILIIYCESYHIFFNMFDIVANYLLNDLSNVYHSYFMKFYQLYKIFELFTYDL